jgi:tRNA A37 threonylcarbamoyladenosine dehydratase
MRGRLGGGGGVYGFKGGFGGVGGFGHTCLVRLGVHIAAMVDMTKATRAKATPAATRPCAGGANAKPKVAK